MNSLSAIKVSVEHHNQEDRAEQSWCPYTNKLKYLWCVEPQLTPHCEDRCEYTTEADPSSLALDERLCRTTRDGTSISRYYSYRDTR